MRRSLLKTFAVLLVLAAVLAPGAAARPDPASIKLALLPLQKADLGPAAASLDIARPYGVMPNWGSRTLEGLGRLGGYELTYGTFFLADPVGLNYVQTAVSEYRTPGNAKHALPFWKKRALRNAEDLTQLNLTTTASSLSLSGIAQPHWARLETFSVTNYGSQYLLKAEFADGNYLIDIAVGAGSQDLATSFATSAAHKLDKRLHLWLIGRLKGQIAPRPAIVQQGPPASGPDPQTMMLQEDDLPPSMELYSEGYEDFPAALSSHSASYYAESSSGPFSNVYQTASLMPSTNSAAYAGAFRGAELLTEQLEYYSYPGYFTQVTPVDLSAVGDEAQGEIITISGDGYTRSVAVITLHSGSVADVVFASRRIPIDPSDVAPLAQAAADRLDAALGP